MRVVLRPPHLGLSTRLRVGIDPQDAHGRTRDDKPDPDLNRRKHGDGQKGCHRLADARLGHVHHEQRGQENSVDDLRRHAGIDGSWLMTRSGLKYGRVRLRRTERPLYVALNVLRGGDGSHVCSVRRDSLDIDRSDAGASVPTTSSPLELLTTTTSQSSSRHHRFVIKQIAPTPHGNVREKAASREGTSSCIMPPDNAMHSPLKRGNR